MKNSDLVACWHHGDIERLHSSLENGFIDIYGKYERTPKRKESSQEKFLKDMNLKPGDRIRIKVRDKIIAYATIVDGKPFDLDQKTRLETGRPWSSGMKVRNIQYVTPPQPASCYPKFQKSHRFDTPEALKLDR